MALFLVNTLKSNTSEVKVVQQNLPVRSLFSFIHMQLTAY